MTSCKIVLYAGNNKMEIARQSVKFNPSFLEQYVTGKISKEDFDAYRQNTIDEYCLDFKEMIANRCLNKPKIVIEYKSRLDEDDDISTQEILKDLSKTERDTNVEILREKLKKYFG